MSNERARLRCCLDALAPVKIDLLHKKLSETQKRFSVFTQREIIRIKNQHNNVVNAGERPQPPRLEQCDGIVT